MVIITFASGCDRAYDEASNVQQVDGSFKGLASPSTGGEAARRQEKPFCLANARRSGCAGNTSHQSIVDGRLNLIRMQYKLLSVRSTEQILCDRG